MIFVIYKNSFVFEKACGQLLRLCGIIKLINNICHLLDQDLAIVSLSIEEFVKHIDNQTIDPINKKAS